MTDVVSPRRRSEIMALVGHKDTRPEKIVRSFLHKKGLRYRLHVKELPGKPDLVFPRYKTVVFINGCFWHGHKDKKCKLARMPKSNVKFWKSKIQKNQIRDQKNTEQLRSLNWRVIIVWECQLNQKGLLERLAKDIVCFCGEPINTGNN